MVLVNVEYLTFYKNIQGKNDHKCWNLFRSR